MKHPEYRMFDKYGIPLPNEPEAKALAVYELLTPTIGEWSKSGCTHTTELRDGTMVWLTEEEAEAKFLLVYDEKQQIDLRYGMTTPEREAMFEAIKERKKAERRRNSGSR